MARCVDHPRQLMKSTRSASGAAGSAVEAMERRARHSGGSNGGGSPVSATASRPRPQTSRMRRFQRGCVQAQSSTRPRKPPPCGRSSDPRARAHLGEPIIWAHAGTSDDSRGGACPAGRGAFVTARVYGNTEFRIGDRPVGPGHPCYVIAEAGSNHNRDLDDARSLDRGRRRSRRRRRQVPDVHRRGPVLAPHPGDELPQGAGAPRASASRSGSSSKRVEMPWEWHAELARHSAECGITFFSTPFEEEAVDLLEEVGVPAYKIASYEVNHLPTHRARRTDRQAAADLDRDGVARRHRAGARHRGCRGSARSAGHALRRELPAAVRGSQPARDHRRCATRSRYRSAGPTTRRATPPMSSR